MAHGEVDVYGALKGGVGKTRIAVLAALRQALVAGEDVHLVDGDRVSQTASDWRKDYERATGREFPVTVTRHPFDDIDELISDLRGKHDRVIADIGGGDPAVFTAALTYAQRLVVPIGADPSEMRRLPSTWKAAQLAAADSAVGGFNAWVLLSRTDHGTTLPREYRELLTSGKNPETGDALPVYPLLKAEMRKRVAYQRAYGTVPGEFYDVPSVLEEIGVIKTGAEAA
ncbi:ParA family protein [Streptomyces abyssomicinicus]|uniref:ParA family protein n=1 Tax=Streptomyces abyssomicinicus TaxID=574929 RepID=UPI0012507A66|nr:ParA family protein [Streptomyces abyssomicinicus]